MIPTTPPLHAETKARSENEVRLVVVAFFSCHLLSSPHLLLPSCSPASSSSLQVKLIILQVDWVILCLAVLLGYCFVCLSGNAWHKLSRLCLIPLRWLLRMASRGLWFYWCFHCSTETFVGDVCTSVCMSVRVCMQAWARACLSECVPVFK